MQRVFTDMPLSVACASPPLSFGDWVGFRYLLCPGYCHFFESFRWQFLRNRPFKKLEHFEQMEVERHLLKPRKKKRDPWRPHKDSLKPLVLPAPLEGLPRHSNLQFLHYVYCKVVRDCADASQAQQLTERYCRLIQRNRRARRALQSVSASAAGLGSRRNPVLRRLARTAAQYVRCVRALRARAPARDAAIKELEAVPAESRTPAQRARLSRLQRRRLHQVELDAAVLRCVASRSIRELQESNFNKLDTLFWPFRRKPIG